jgi:hypothetical protein
LMVNCWGLKVLWYGQVCAGRNGSRKRWAGGTGEIVRYACVVLPCTYCIAYQQVVKFGFGGTLGDTAAEAVEANVIPDAGGKQDETNGCTRPGLCRACKLVVDPDEEGG